ncbi:LacI family DNA-binding transcriptional regulator [Kineosporia succinea]|uniref:DNA-binding LacI/PurR family transcriptional regulator n=1 Tax=Kineosporia succinea TaxID=84632 RepID=A0ABT9PA41_9ACTN|nr:GntR family transcriptional regulator [Kineosporia succinea]MDP9829558.1 DNA-binding LacI/PurR family transcriptional regulator [Kineosporia succinea]
MTSTARPPGVSLFYWVKESLRQSIARGDYDPDTPFVTQREIVERFGVSTTTAVRALNDLVAEGVVVRRRGLGTFVVSRQPERLRATSGPATIAYVSPDSDGHKHILQRGLAAEAALLGHRLLVANTLDQNHEERTLLEVADSGADAVVLYPWNGSHAGGVVTALESRGVAVVLVDRYFPDVPTDAVLFDDFAIGHDVTSAVIARGHRAPALLWSESDTTSVRDRRSGYFRALREAGLPELPERSVLTNYYDLPQPSRIERLQRLFASPEGLSAVICANAATMGVLIGDLLAPGLDLPGHVEMASMDDGGPEGLSPLAAVAAQLPARAMGTAAAQLIHERLSGPDGPRRHVVLPARLKAAGKGQRLLSLSRPAPESSGSAQSSDR